jgi:hypothetical protein
VWAVFFKSQVARLRKLTHVYAGQYFAYFLGSYQIAMQASVGSLELLFKSLGLLAFSHLLP